MSLISNRARELANAIDDLVLASQPENRSGENLAIVHEDLRESIVRFGDAVRETTIAELTEKIAARGAD